MTTADRDRLIDTYFEAMDTEDPGRLRSKLAEEFRYESLAGHLEGPDGMDRYLTDLRSVSNTTHDSVQRIHGPEATAVEGIAHADTAEGDRVTINFCNVFEFDDTDEQITRIAVYVDNT